MERADTATPKRELVLANDAVHYFAKDVLRMTADKDPVDCLKDLELVKQVLRSELSIDRY